MTDWSKLKVVDLKSELKKRDLPQNGLKADLVARLQEADASAANQVEGASEAVPTEPEHVEKIEEASHPQTDLPETLEDAGEFAEPGANAPKLPASAETAAAIDASVGQADNEQVADQRSETEVKESLEQEIPAEVSTSIGSTEEVKQTEATSTEQVAPPEPSITAGQDDQMAIDTPSTAQPLEPEGPEAAQFIPAVSEEVNSNVPESQSRKRRSKSPPPDDDFDMRKRPRTSSIGAFNRQMAPLTSAPNIQEERQRGESMDMDHDIAPALHPATTALCIRNLMRPLRPADLKSHLVNLATPSTADLDDSVISTLFLDQIRTHAFVVFTSVAAASRVRSQLHDCVWPKESNRKPLSVDFIPPDKVQEWIDKEEPSGGGRSRNRWEVVYEPNSDGEIEARLEIASVPSSRGPVPTGPTNNLSLSSVNAMPTGPKAMRDPPRGPRGFRQDTGFSPPPAHSHRGPMGPGAGPPPASYDATSERTRTSPVVAYKPVSDGVAQRRLAGMRSYYTKDLNKPLGREINRYSFQHGDGFVDRGKEIFEGIRPPHRERARREGRSGYFDGNRGWRGGRGGRRGGGRGGMRTDRYMPDDGGHRLFNDDDRDY